jgi:hypothetical protein
MVTERKSDAELSESLRHDADAGPVVTPNYTVLKREDWERIELSIKRLSLADLERISELVKRLDQMQLRLDFSGGVGKTIMKIAALPDDRIAEIDDFVDFLRQREEQRSLRRDFAALSEPSLAKVWDNTEDSIYDAL